MDVNFEIKGVTNLKRRINKISDTCKDISKGLKKVGEEFRQTESKIFSSQGAYGSRSRWKALKQPNRTGRILQDTNALRISLVSRGGNNIEKITKNSITLGTKDPKFKFHQQGTRKMPARPPITITKYQTNKWVKIIKDEILKGL